MTHVVTPQPRTFNLMARFWAFIETVKDARQRRMAYNKAYAELQMLSDHELVEYGLHRSDLVDLARTAAAKSFAA